MYLHDLHTSTSELLKYYFLLARLLGDPDLIVNKNNVVNFSTLTWMDEEMMDQLFAFLNMREAD